MFYISRRFSTNQGEKEISENEFLALEGPLIVLGEPGAGKSEFVRHLQIQETYSASSVLSFPSGIPLHHGRVIIDGLDEVTAYSTGAPIAQVLAKIPNEDISKFIFTCRAVDWTHSINAEIFKARWKKPPVIGKLLPLGNNEIVSFVELYGNGQNGARFLKQAAKHDSVDLLRNPQTLLMLIKTVTRTGWPTTKTQLYEETCNALVEENNEFHSASGVRVFTKKQLLNAAGAISAQMILGNKSFVNLDGHGSDGSVSVQDLISDDFNNNLIRQALSTKIFRIVSPITVECSHRTLLEYLAAKFLTQRLRDSLSIRRLETVLYGAGYIVPPALRGLHAWIATMDNGVISRLFIDRDPYGVFRYGDSAMLSISLVRQLLKSLHKLAVDDPNFRDEDWHATIGNGFAKDGLKKEVVKLLKDSGVPFQLRHLIIESLRGQTVVSSIAGDLVAVVLKKSGVYIERAAALDALQECQVPPSWKELAKKLISYKDMDSLRLALDIVRSAIASFKGKAIAELLVAISYMSRRGTSIIGLGHGLSATMTDQQLSEALKTLIRHKFSENHGEPICDDPKDWIFDLLLECFERLIVLDASSIWHAMNRLKRHYRSNRNEMESSASQYFKVNPPLRRAIQWEALFGAQMESYSWNFFRLEEASSALVIDEEDVLVHLKRVMDERGDQWIQRWAALAWYVVRNTNFVEANRLMREYADAFPEFGAALENLEKPRDRSVDHEERRDVERWKREQRRQVEERIKQYTKIIERIKRGKQLDAICEIAKAYLNWYSDVNGDTPDQRVADLVGEDNKVHAINSFVAAIQNAEIPGASEIVAIRMEHKEYLVAPVLIAYCSQVADKTKLKINIITAALAACRWGFHFATDNISPKVQAELEQIVFADKDLKKQFLRDTFEPQLSKSEEYIHGLRRLSSEDLFSDVAGQLSVEWMQTYPALSTSTLTDLLKCAVYYRPTNEIISLATRKVESLEHLPNDQFAIWLSLLFLFDLEKNTDRINAAAAGDCSKFWIFRDAHKDFFKSEKLSPDQNYFFAKIYSSCFSDDDTFPAGFMGSNHPWEAREYLNARANELAANISDRATGLLRTLLGDLKPGTRFYNHVKHVLAQHLRLKAENEMTHVSLGNVKAILFNGSPRTLQDLQSIILDQLTDLQRRLQGSPTNDYLMFWNDTSPHKENYCRDRIVHSFDPYVNRLGIRSHVEAQMPNVKRCDFLNTWENMDLPVEVKGQWHGNLWTAAIDQLEDYSKEYRAEGYGIYMVLWFGVSPKLKNKNPSKDMNGCVPESAQAMYDLLVENYREEISTKTKLFVLDVSKPLSGSRKKKIVGKTSRMDATRAGRSRTRSSKKLASKPSLVKKRDSTHTETPTKRKSKSTRVTRRKEKPRTARSK